MTECSGCGSCCQPVVLPFTKDELMRAKGVPERTRDWIMNDLTPMPRREAKQREPWLFAIDRVLADYDGIIDIEDNYPMFYRCRWFDDDRRTCTNYDNRPEPCRRYPWPNGKVNRRAALPPTCSFRADQGLPVESVRFVRKVRTTKVKCRKCGEMMDTSVGDEVAGVVTPEIGSVGICLKCGVTGIWGEYMLRAPTDDEWKRLEVDERYLKAIAVAQGVLNRRRLQDLG